MRSFILGTDWWTDCDDAVAIRILARAHSSGKLRLKGIGVNACMEYSVRSLDVYLRLNGAENIPIGIDLEATDFVGIPSFQKGWRRILQSITQIKMRKMPLGCTEKYWQKQMNPWR